MDNRKLSNILNKIKSTYKSLSPEKVMVIWFLALVSFICFFAALVTFNNRFLVIVPTYGGEVNEGIIGTPRYINPVLATSEQDKDLTSLIYAGLTKKDSLGNTVLDMAESIVESDDHLRYTVKIKSDAKFHDGESVTADDVIYTVSLIQNPIIKSPYRIKWEGITIQKLSDTEIVFILKKPYVLFMNILDMGILPKHLWKDLNEDQFSLSDYNIHAIGSGPYKINNIETISGIPNIFVLDSHKNYTSGRPYLKRITIKSYANEKNLLQALNKGEISRVHGISPSKVKDLNISESSIHTSLLPRTITVFFNPNKATDLSDKNFRSALELAIDKKAIVEKVLNNYGKVVNTPYAFGSEESVENVYDLEKAKDLLSQTKAFKQASSTISITLTTANTEEMKMVAEMIQADWEQLGVKTTLAIYEVSDLNQTVIKDRNFEALLFGSITESPSDLYAFWHSSQRSYPGLNISNYVSKSLDENLEVLRTSTDAEDRKVAYTKVVEEFKEETPGIFIFAPSLIYITKDTTTTLMPEYSFDNSSRFTLIHKWYRYTEKVWPKTYYKNITETLQNILK